jgi:hypothetical protein
MMGRIKHYIFIVVIFFSWVSFTYADFEITEIMYDQEGTDTNREWVEVKNVGSTPSDLSKWFLFSDNTKHSLVPQGESIIPVGGYAVIVQNVSQFNLDYLSFRGILFDSSWTGFNNTTESVSLKDSDLNIVSPVIYTSVMGGNGNGNSLSKINGSWQNGIPTPGKDNQIAFVPLVSEVKKTIQKDSSATKPVSSLVSQNDNSQDNSSMKNGEVINLNDLELNVMDKTSGVSNLAYSLIGLFIVVALGITSFLVIKIKHRKSEKISAEDMTIVE